MVTIFLLSSRLSANFPVSLKKTLLPPSYKHLDCGCHNAMSYCMLCYLSSCLSNNKDDKMLSSQWNCLDCVIWLPCIFAVFFCCSCLFLVSIISLDCHCNACVSVICIYFPRGSKKHLGHQQMMFPIILREQWDDRHVTSKLISK